MTNNITPSYCLFSSVFFLLLLICQLSMVFLCGGRFILSNYSSNIFMAVQCVALILQHFHVSLYNGHLLNCNCQLHRIENRSLRWYIEMKYISLSWLALKQYNNSASVSISPIAVDDLVFVAVFGLLSLVVAHFAMRRLQFQLFINVCIYGRISNSNKCSSSHLIRVPILYMFALKLGLI